MEHLRRPVGAVRPARDELHPPHPDAVSLQASYAAPLILLAQNRQADRDRVALEQDRARDERNLADTEFLTREVAALRIALRDMATRDFVRSELRDLLDEMEERGLTSARAASDEDGTALIPESELLPRAKVIFRNSGTEWRRYLPAPTMA